MTGRWKKENHATRQTVKLHKTQYRSQRRFWMEEICANLTGEGRLKPTSVWKPSFKEISRKETHCSQDCWNEAEEEDPDTTLKRRTKNAWYRQLS
jgi:hypothetical protein